MSHSKRQIIFISDGTGITAENLGHSLLTQFEHISFETTTIPYVDSVEKAQEAYAKIVAIGKKADKKPIVFSTLVEAETYGIIKKAPCVCLGLFHTFVPLLQKELGVSSLNIIGNTHGFGDDDHYMHRIDAVNYAIANDDGANIHRYDEADFILLGVSRSGKTPTCLYLALQFGVYCANYPLTEEDVAEGILPKPLQPYREKLVGLIIEPARLQHIREARHANSRYCSIKQCQQELRFAEKLYLQEAIPYIDTTKRSIEEIATEIFALTGKKKHII